MNLNCISRFLVVAVVSMAVPLAARAVSIGVNFGEPNSSFEGRIGPLLSAGVVPQTNWMDVTVNSVTNLPLTNSLGVATSALLTYDSGNGFPLLQSAGVVAETSGDELLNNSFLWTGDVTPPQFTISLVPYAIYDVIAYISSGSVGRVHAVTAGGATYYGTTPTSTAAPYIDNNAGTAYLYTRATSTNVGTPTANANYYRFNGLTSSTLTITVANPSANDVLQLSAFQIIDAVPEPGSAVLLIGGGCALVLRRRRTKG